MPKREFAQGYERFEVAPERGAKCKGWKPYLVGWQRTAITAVTLGPVKRIIGTRHECIDIGCVRSLGQGDAEAGRYVDGLFQAYIEGRLVDGRAQAFGKLQRSSPAVYAKLNRELLSTNSSDTLAISHLRYAPSCESLRSRSPAGWP